MSFNLVSGCWNEVRRGREGAAQDWRSREGKRPCRESRLYASNFCDSKSIELLRAFKYVQELRNLRSHFVAISQSFLQPLWHW